MNKIVSIAFFEIKKNVRDIKMLLLLVVTPIITIFILGKSLDAFLTMESMPTPLVGYVNHDEGNLSDSFDSFIKSNEIKDIIEILEYETQEEAAVALEKGNVNCIIFINNNFSKLLTDGNTSVIEIYGTKNSTYVEAVVNSYLNTYNLTISLLKNNLPVDQEIQDYKLERGQLNSKGVFPNSLDYYSVQTLLQILMICSVFGVSIILRDINGGLSIRINSLPVKKYQLIIGRLIGCILYSFIAAFVSILFSKYVFKANWDGNLLIISSTILLFVIIVVGIGVLLALITKSNTTSFGIIALLSFILPASVGAFSPKTTVEAIAILSPNYYAKNIIMGSLFDFPNKVIVQGYIGLVIMVVIVYGLIFFFEGRRKYANI